MFASKKEFDFFCAWYFRAQLDENYDADRQFFYYYALIDHLMKSFGQEHEKELSEQGLQLSGGEKVFLKFFLFHILYIEPESKQFETFNPFKILHDSNMELFLNKVKCTTDKKLFTEFKLPSFEYIILLFLEIYNIRYCLFHGETDLGNHECNKLIEEANVVLKSFLDRLFEAKIYQTNNNTKEIQK